MTGAAPTTQPEGGPETVAVAADNGGREAARARARAFTSLVSRNAAVSMLIVVVIVGS